MAQTAGATEGAGIPALRRSVRILDHVARSATPPTAAEIARALALPKSTAHGLLSVLLELDLLVRAPDGTFRPGGHPLRWANAFVSRMDMVGVFAEHATREPALARHTLTLSTLDGPDVVYVACRNSDEPLGQTFRIGMRLPAAFTATGKAMLAEGPPEHLAAIGRGGLPAPLTGASVRDMAALHEELAATRQRGFSIDDGQVRDGMICIGAAIRDHTGTVVAGIAASLLRADQDAARIADIGARIRATANAISVRLGHADAPTRKHPEY